jgi:hypothetical protein
LQPLRSHSAQLALSATQFFSSLTGRKHLFLDLSKMGKFLNFSNKLLCKLILITDFAPLQSSEKNQAACWDLFVVATMRPPVIRKIKILF